MADQDQISNMGMSDDARTMLITIQVPSPVENQVIYSPLRSAFPIRILRFHYLRASGTCKFTPRRDASVLTTDQSDGNGKITVNQPSTTVATVNDTQDTIVQNQSLNITITDVSSAAWLVIEVVCRRTEVNV